MTMSDFAYASFCTPGSFQRDRRYTKPAVEEAPIQVETEDASDKAYHLGFKEGYNAARSEFEAKLEEERAGRANIETAFARFDSDSERLLRDRILATVHSLCEEAVLPLALDADGLARRVDAAAAMLQRKHDERVIHVHPDDLKLIQDNVADDLKLISDKTVERGGLRVETENGGVEDGPEQWRRALAEVFSSCKD
jgi:flagellar assembly protein FliH